MSLVDVVHRGSMFKASMASTFISRSEPPCDVVLLLLHHVEEWVNVFMEEDRALLVGLQLA